MDTQALILLQLELECIRVNTNGYLESFQCDNPDEAARLYVYQDRERYYRFLRQDVEPTLRQHLKLLPEKQLFEEVEMVQRSLSEEKACESIFQGRCYIFPQETLAESEDDKAVIQKESSLCTIEYDGKIVAACSSVRENEKAAEAWVHTEEAFRGKGYGRRVTLAWARLIAKKGKIPFYSHSIHNLGSQNLVAKLPFIWVFDLISYS